MSRISRRTLLRVGFSTILAASLAYNYLWASTAPLVFALHCQSLYAEVRRDAIALKGSADWTPAAHLYGFLILYHPDSSTYCKPHSTDPDWLLPLGTLAWNWRADNAAQRAANGPSLDLEWLREDYRTSLENAAASGRLPDLTTADPK